MTQIFVPHKLLNYKYLVWTWGGGGSSFIHNNNQYAQLALAASVLVMDSIMYLVIFLAGIFRVILSLVS